MESITLACALLIPVLAGVRGQQMLLHGDRNTTLEQHHCPPWATAPPNHTACTCKEQHDSTVVVCNRSNPSQLQLLACYCLSYYHDLNTTVYGKCMYTCSFKHYYHVSDSHYYHVSDRICDKFNRQGELCSRCQNGTGHPLYSYKLNCTTCTDDAITLFQYVVVAYLPLTVFFVLVMAFRISANAETLSGYILMSQIVTTPAQLRYLDSLPTDKSGSLAISIGLSVHAIWNLDFFRGLYRPFCYNESMSTLLIVSLD